MLTRKPPIRRLAFLVLPLLLTLGPTILRADDDQGSDTFYRRVNLVSDLPGVAKLQDTNLVNAWGLAFSSSSPVSVSIPVRPPLDICAQRIWR